jgi:hypothetical protein
MLKHLFYHLMEFVISFWLKGNIKVELDME